MSEIGTYTFLPWMRQGIANRITDADGDTAVVARPKIDIEVSLSATGRDGTVTETAHTRQVQLYGPGDITGIENRAIVRVEPQNWITNFEPNYLPFIEFYDETMPWRYTPAAPDMAAGRLRPWLTLAVLEESEFTDGRMAGRPLPYIEIENAASVLPDASELWAFAHVHVNEDITGNTGDDPRNSDGASLGDDLEQLLSQNADQAYSRLISPRKLLPNRRYHAFLIPTFEAGRIAGLGDVPEGIAGLHATLSAWESYPGRPKVKEYPYYHRWQFRTGDRGDFEHLVRLLEPRPAPPIVGRREVDVLAPGSGVGPIDDVDLAGVLRFGGALRTPVATMPRADREEVEKYDNWAIPGPHPHQVDLAALINLADDYSHAGVVTAHSSSSLDDGGLADPDAEDDDDPDPVVTAPLYGRWHALTPRLLEERDGSPVRHADNWVHDLNLDPRWRSAAGLGTQVMQENQEEYLDAAWGQVGEILEANRKLRQAQLAKAASDILHQKHIDKLAVSSPVKALSLTAPQRRRIVIDGTTLTYKMRSSTLSQSMVTPMMRRAIRPGAPIAKRSAGRLNSGERAAPSAAIERAAIPIESLANRVNDGAIVLEPIAQSEQTKTIDDIAEAFAKKPGANFTVDVGSGSELASRWQALSPLRRALLAVALILILLALNSGPFFGLFFLSTALGLAWLALRGTEPIGSGSGPRAGLDSANQKPAIAASLPENPNFTLVPEFRPGLKIDALPKGEGPDSIEAARYRAALSEALDTIDVAQVAGAPLTREPLAITEIAREVSLAISPSKTIPSLIYRQIRLPAMLIPERPEYLEPAMAYPEFDVPMYEPLLRLGTDHFVPNLGKLRENSITLLETNQRFIESYMVGLNHECARELQFHEWPGDMRGSYFRQFWDVSDRLDDAEGDPVAWREKLKDIPPLHRWPINSDLGDHDNREAGREAEEELVLVIRGELLKKYPNAVIYARRARWARKADGKIDKEAERELEDAPDILSNIKTPLFQAKASPDIYFLGFDITATVARGGDGGEETDDPGWFFVIQERPGEPRFGLDIERSGQLNVWNDLAWKDVLNDAAAGGFLTPGANAGTLNLIEPTAVDVAAKADQWKEDRFVDWSGAMNAADMAYVLFQSPVMVAVHAADMLPKGED